MRRLCAVIVLVLAVPAVALAATVRIGDRANGHSVVLHKGDTLVVTVAAHNDGGYVWKLKHTSPAVLRLVRHRYFPPPSTAPPGASGTDVFRFRAAGAGWTTLRLSDVRSFDPKHPCCPFRIRVKVKR